MNEKLPIVVKPLRWRWGLKFLAALAAFVYVLAYSPTPVSAVEEWVAYGIIAFLGLVALLTGWGFFFAKPRIIVDERGVGGRFICGDFVGTDRIAWDDIIGVRFSVEIPLLGGSGRERRLTLDVVNDGGKYYRKRKNASPKPGRNNDDDFLFAFDVTYSNINDARAKEIVAVINNLAKGKPPEGAKESGKSPFAAD